MREIRPFRKAPLSLASPRSALGMCALVKMGFSSPITVRLPIGARLEYQWPVVLYSSRFWYCHARVRIAHQEPAHNIAQRFSSRPLARRCRRAAAGGCLYCPEVRSLCRLIADEQITSRLLLLFELSPRRNNQDRADQSPQARSHSGSRNDRCHHDRRALAGALRATPKEIIMTAVPAPNRVPAAADRSLASQRGRHRPAAG